MSTIYDGIKECYYRISAKALIRNSEWKFAMSKEHTWKWDMPWGGIDHGETPHEALKREIMEEMWLSVTKISPQPIYSFLTESSWIASPKRPLCLLIFETEVEDFEFTPSDECMEIAFVNTKEAQDLDLYHPNISVMKEIEKLEA